MTLAHPRLTVLALTAAALTACGCGKSSKSLTRAELIAKADVICKRVNDQLKSSNNAIKSQQDIARVAPRLASFELGAVAELSKLLAPASMAGDWKTIVIDAQTLAGNTARLGEYAETGKLEAARSLIARSQKTQEQMVSTAKRNGFEDCSQSA